MAVKFKPAPEVEEAAIPIIAGFHSHLHRHHAKIIYLFRDKPEKLRGSSCAATARLTTGLSAYLAAMGETDQEIEEREEENETSNSESSREPGTPFFVISVYEPGWHFMNPEEREALIDHELCHLGADFDDKGRSKFWIIPHDMEEFNAIYERRGAWNRRIREFLRAGMPKDDGQMPFDFGGATGEDASPRYPAITGAGPAAITGNGEGVRAIEGERKQIAAAGEDPDVVEGEFTAHSEGADIDATAPFEEDSAPRLGRMTWHQWCRAAGHAPDLKGGPAWDAYENGMNPAEWAAESDATATAAVTSPRHRRTPVKPESGTSGSEVAA